MADRLATILPDQIGQSQEGFIEGRSAVSNLRKVLAVLDRVKMHPLPHKHPVLVTLDAEKAFDSVRWSWLDLVLDRMGLIGHFCTLLTSIYNNPTAQIHTPGFVSEPIMLTKGTRQGCPLSPLLFDLALEPLARYLEDTNLFGGRETVHLAMFADDVIFFLSDPVTHLPGVF